LSNPQYLIIVITALYFRRKIWEIMTSEESRDQSKEAIVIALNSTYSYMKAQQKEFAIAAANSTKENRKWLNTFFGKTQSYETIDLKRLENQESKIDQLQEKVNVKDQDKFFKKNFIIC